MKRSNFVKEDEMQRRYVLEKKRFFKIQKSEVKICVQMFKQSLRLSIVGLLEDDRVKMKQVRIMFEYFDFLYYFFNFYFMNFFNFKFVYWMEWKRLVFVESQF